MAGTEVSVMERADIESVAVSLPGRAHDCRVEWLKRRCAALQDLVCCDCRVGREMLYSLWRCSLETHCLVMAEIKKKRCAVYS